MLITKLLWPLIDPAATPLFFAAVMVAAFYGGLGPGLLATALSTWAIDFFFTPPFNSLEFSVANVVRAVVFMSVATTISWLNAARKRLMDDLNHWNREREALMTQISGFNEELRNEVEAATQALLSANHNLFETQQRLIRSERLAVAGQMAASLAHEIGTPLNAISGHLQLLARDHPQHADTQRRVQIIIQQLDFIVKIVKSLLTWTHKKQVELLPTDVNALVRELLWLVSPTLEQRSITVDAALGPDLPPIAAHRDGLRQVFLNLINNSVDAMPNGGRLRVSTHLDPQSGAVELMFCDTGYGIDPSAIDHLFEPMWTSKDSGSGFGLAIAREIMSDHNGRIEVIQNQDTAQGDGAAFRLILPLAVDEMSAAHTEEVMSNVA
jgi:signal transduction histidine kinase